MAKKSRPTDSEVAILRVLWTHGPATVREVHTHLSDSREIGYTTVLKLMQIMTDKNLLARDETQRSHVYRPKQKAETTQRRIVRDLVSRVFSGATDKLVMQALANKQATPDQIAKIQKILDEIEGVDQ